MQYLPHEFAIGGVYFPPLLLASILGVLLAVLTALLLNRYRLSRFFLLSTAGLPRPGHHLYGVDRDVSYSGMNFGVFENSSEHSEIE